MAKQAYDAIVVGSGPNGLAAAITLAQAGRSVLLREAASTVGGGMRTAEVTLPGFQHDICSAVLPLGVASPFFRTLPLEAHGLRWLYPPLALAHPFDDGTVATLERSVPATGATLGNDNAAYQRLMAPFVTAWPDLEGSLLGPLAVPPHPFALAAFGLQAIRSATGLARGLFKDEHAQGLLAGLAAHSIQSLDRPATAAFGLVLGILGHAVGWPVAEGGSAQLARALASYFRSLGGEIETNAPVTSLVELPSAQALLFDVTPRQLLRIVGNRLPAGYRRKLEQYRYGPGVFKVDYALDGPLPWRASAVLRAGTVHLGGSLAEIARSEAEVAHGQHPEKPFVLLAQQSLFDPSRAPAGKHTLWAYCHVPNGSTVDMTEAIERQIERFAPGFRERVLARSVLNTRAMEAHNANYVGGDINGGIQDLRQLWTRPAARLVPYSTPDPAIYLCSSSTPPGGGVHGMCGYYAARAVLQHTS